MDTHTEQTEQSASTSSSQNSSLQAHIQRSVTVKKKARLELEHASTKLGDRERAAQVFDLCESVQICRIFADLCRYVQICRIFADLCRYVQIRKKLTYSETQ